MILVIYTMLSGKKDPLNQRLKAFFRDDYVYLITAYQES